MLKEAPSGTTITGGCCPMSYMFIRRYQHNTLFAIETCVSVVFAATAMVRRCAAVAGAGSPIVRQIIIQYIGCIIAIANIIRIVHLH